MTGLLLKELVIRGDAGKIMEEVMKHLTTFYEADVQVTESTRRTVEENCRALRFYGFGFDVE